MCEDTGHLCVLAASGLYGGTSMVAITAVPGLAAGRGNVELDL